MRIIAGVDEVGRGSLIGPVYAAAVILNYSIDKKKINPKVVLKLTKAQLRSCGLSRQKISGIKNLAKQILDKSFNPKLIKNMRENLKF